MQIKFSDELIYANRNFSSVDTSSFLDIIVTLGSQVPARIFIKSMKTFLPKNICSFPML